MTTPCKHLDYDEAKFGEHCTLRELPGTGIRYWERRHDLLPEGAAQNVQFCGQGRGRINSIVDCYNPDEMPCYEAEGIK